MKHVETELTYYKRLEKIGAELAEAVLAFADPQNMGFKEPPLPRFNLDQWWRIVALAREFQKAKEE